MRSTSEASKIVARWLTDLSYSAATRNLAAHMDLVSRQVHVYGVPGTEVVDYRGWEKRRRNEFNRGLLKSLSHKDIEVISSADGHIAFDVTESIKGSSGEQVRVRKNVVLAQEDDGKWRVVLERIDQVECTPPAVSTSRAGKTDAEPGRG